MEFFTFLIINIIRILKYAILARVLLSWVQVNPHNSVVRLIHEISEPTMKLFRNLLPRMGMIDLSPILAFLALDLLQVALASIMMNL